MQQLVQPGSRQSPVTQIGRLTVGMAGEDEVYKDLARVHAMHRRDLPSGRIYRVSTGTHSKYLILRGLRDDEADYIFLDEPSRIRMNVDVGKAYDFAIQPAGSWGYLVWAWKASDPAYSIAAKLGVISFALGVFSFVPVLYSALEWMWGLTWPLVAPLVQKILVAIG